MTNEYIDKHTQSELWASAADEAERHGETVKAQMLRRRAAELEEIAVSEFSPDKPRTLAALGLSTAALYFKAGDHNKAAEIARKMLAIPEVKQQDYFRIQLEEIMTDIDSGKKYKAR